MPSHEILQPQPTHLRNEFGPSPSDSTTALETVKEEQVPVPPADFVYHEDLDATYQEQVEDAILRQKYQDAPTPSFEHVPTTNITPTFNPTAAPPGEIYARGRVPHALKLYAEQVEDPAPVEMWRVVERSKVVDGTGLVSSQVLLNNTLGEIEGFDDMLHFASSTDEVRTSDPNKATPFVSFSTDPTFLARSISGGFGTRSDRDSVVVRAIVDPNRFISFLGGRKKEAEVYLVGGLAPTEYLATYEVSDFIAGVAPSK